MIDSKPEEMYNGSQPQLQSPAPNQSLNAMAQLGDQYRAAQWAKCAQGNHAVQTKYGVCGIITAVACFPIGLICLFMDKEEVCKICGEVVSKSSK